MSGEVSDFDILRDIVSVPVDDSVERLRETLFDKQKEVIDDPAKRVAWLCSRRAGKTQSAVRKLLITALGRPRSVCLYFATTLKAARKLVWDSPEGIPFLIDSMKLPATYSNSEHRVDCFNGSKIWISGAEDEKDASRWLGVRSDLDIIDESQEFPDHVLRHLIFRVLSPSLMDRGGSLVLSGTPHPACFGTFFEATKEETGTLKTHRWTFRQNPFLKDPETWLAEECLQRGMHPQDPEYEREFNGRWVREDSALVYQFNEKMNWYDELPVAVGDRYWVLGVDLGWEDATAFVLGTYETKSPFFHVVEAFSKKHLLTDQIAETIKGFQAQHPDMRIIMDCGGLGKTISEDMRQRYGIPIAAAQKTEKLAHQRNMNNDLRTGKLFVHRQCRSLVDQMHLLRKQPDGKEETNKPNDLCDATLYCHRTARAFQGRPDEPKVKKVATPDVVERLLFENAMKQAKEQSRMDQDAFGDYDRARSSLGGGGWYREDEF